MAQTVEGLMKTTMENIKNMIDVNTVVGDAVETKEGAVILPISKVSFAFVAGGGEFANKKTGDEGNAGDKPFAGGTGAGVSVHPIGFLAAINGQLRMLPVECNNTIDRIIELAPNFIENIEGFLAKRAECRKEEVKKEAVDI